MDFETNMIDASKIHECQTKHLYVSFVTSQTSEILFDYEKGKINNLDSLLFDTSKRPYKGLSAVSM